MNGKNAIGIFIVETPVHCGTGQDVGIVDQPIQRERYTGYPRIQGSEIKGVFRQYCKGENEDEIFGPRKSGDEGGDYASAVSFGDARVLFFPVKSLKGTYVWITSKDVLYKFSRTLKLVNVNKINVPDIVPSDDEHIIVYSDSIVVNDAANDKVVLEEYIFKKQNGTANEFDSIINAIVPNSTNEYKYLRESLKKKVCIVPTDIFREFTEMSTEVITRIKINDKTGVAAPGALWTEEYLPTDTIMYFPVFANETKNTGSKLNAGTVINKIKTLNSYIQIGGNETVGKGFVKINWLE